MLQRNTGGVVIVGHLLDGDGNVLDPAVELDHNGRVDRPDLLPGFVEVKPKADPAPKGDPKASKPPGPSPATTAPSTDGA